MTASIVGTLTQSQVEQAQSQAQAIANSASQTISKNQFVFFAAFDGTNNDMNSVPQGEQNTNTAQLWKQVKSALEENPNLGGNYYPGPGTSGSLPGSSAIPAQVTQEAINTGTRAYYEFRDQAIGWLNENPDANPQTAIATAICSFSRGVDAAAVFAQLLYEKGLSDPDSGMLLIPPGQLGISAAVIYEPVATGMSGNVAFPNAQNMVVIQADNEYRTMFKAVDFTEQAGATTFGNIGNHCDIGGCYANGSGIGNLTLQAGTSFLQKSGMALADVPEGRRFEATAPTVVHNEGIDDLGREIWGTYGTYGQYTGPRLTDAAATQPVTSTEGNTTTTNFKDFANKDITLTKTQTEDTGDVVIENANEGNDTVQSSITWTLGDNVENLYLSGATAINGTGNGLDNVLTGNSAANILTGGAGNDTYVVSNTDDVVVENASEGNDTVQSTATYTLSANVENLTLTGTAAIDGTGNSLDNILIGNNAANTLNGDLGSRLAIQPTWIERS